MTTARLFFVPAALFLATAAFAADWPQWGGNDGRNMVSTEKNLPDCFVPIRTTGEASPDPSKPTNVKWVARLGHTTYGNPTVANGRVFVGTDTASLDEDRRFNRMQGGIVKCFEEATGKLLWQLVVPQRTGYPKTILYGHQKLGICSSPLVDGDRVYVFAHTTEVLCLDIHGQANGNDGPVQDEAQYMAGANEKPVTLKPTDGDIIWRYDLMKELGVCPHDTASCSILMHGDLIYLSTSNGVDQPHRKMLNPDAPALIVLDKRTGKLAATENEKISSRIIHCQWSPPSLGKVGDKNLVFFGGADAFCYAFEALETVPVNPVTLKKVWSYDVNPPEYKVRDGKPIDYLKGDKRKKDSDNKNDGTYVGFSEIIGTPVFHNGRVYVAIGQDPAHGRGKGMLHCIDASKTGDITKSGKIWSYDGLDRTIATPTIADGLVYIPDVAGRVHCVDADTGKPYWVFETKAEAWGSVLVADGKLYFGNQRECFILAAGKELKVLNRVRLSAAMFSTPIVANGAVFIACDRYLWAVRGQK